MAFEIEQPGDVGHSPVDQAVVAPAVMGVAVTAMLATF
jgi:hypothetical protein